VMMRCNADDVFVLLVILCPPFQGGGKPGPYPTRIGAGLLLV
jgi:hypothetical protein